MSGTYLRLAEPPALRHPGYPICGACDIEVQHDGDGWLCPSCGTVWLVNTMEADASDAEMYPDWSGEDLTGPVCPNDEAWRFSHLPASERNARIEQLNAGQGTEGDAS